MQTTAVVRGCWLALLTLVPCALAGQQRERITIGPTGVYQNVDEVYGMGAYLSVPAALDGRLSANPNAAFYFPDGYEMFEVDADLTYALPLGRGIPIEPFALGGLGLTVGGVDSKALIALNAGAGIVLRVWNFRPTVGAKVELRDGTPVVYFARFGLAVFE